MSVKNIESASEFADAIKTANTVVHFWEEWAAQCGAMNDVLEELAKDTNLKGLKFAKIKAEDFPEISMKHDISAVPTVILFQNGKAVDRVDGANAAELTKKVKQLASAGPFIPPPADTTQEDLNSRLRKLIKADKVMLFMKGTAKEPKCGFSKQAVALLNDLGADYSTFDILNDDKVRQGLKEFSNWPTYPQLYVNGELVGGLDIMKELVQTDELASMLPKKQSLEERLKSLTNQHKLMIFMKGSRDSPRCGFSKQLMEIMKDTQLEFQTFDILEDEEVRQGLKTFSNWPTYPQVYVKGELVGGLDIIKELKESGDLLNTLKGDS